MCLLKVWLLVDGDFSSPGGLLSVSAGRTMKCVSVCVGVCAKQTWSGCCVTELFFLFPYYRLVTDSHLIDQENELVVHCFKNIMGMLAVENVDVIYRRFHSSIKDRSWGGILWEEMWHQFISAVTSYLFGPLYRVTQIFSLHLYLSIFQKNICSWVWIVPTMGTAHIQFLYSQLDVDDICECE